MAVFMNLIIMMLKRILSFLFIVCGLISLNCWWATSATWSAVQDDPLTVVDVLKSKAQDTKLNDIPMAEGSETPIYDTFKEISNRVGPYIQWAIYIWLSVATILLIFNWVLLVVSPLKDTYANVKTRVTSIFLWVATLTWFFLIIKLLMSIIANII